MPGLELLALAYTSLRGCNRSPTWPCLTASIRAHVWHARRRAPLPCVYGCRRISAIEASLNFPRNCPVRARRYATREVENAALAWAGHDDVIHRRNPAQRPPFLASCWGATEREIMALRF